MRYFTIKIYKRKLRKFITVSTRIKEVFRFIEINYSIKPNDINIIAPVILFDGVCNLCNGAVQFIIKHDRKNIFRFASLQSDAGQQLLKQFSLPQDQFNSFVLIENEKAFTQSVAALRIAKKLSGAVRLLYGFIIVPPFIRNAVYRLIANNRYRWFGKKESCMIPTPELRQKFLN